MGVGGSASTAARHPPALACSPPPASAAARRPLGQTAPEARSCRGCAAGPAWHQRGHGAPDWRPLAARLGGAKAGSADGVSRWGAYLASMQHTPATHTRHVRVAVVAGQSAGACSACPLTSACSLQGVAWPLGAELCTHNAQFVACEGAVPGVQPGGGLERRPAADAVRAGACASPCFCRAQQAAIPCAHCAVSLPAQRPGNPAHTHPPWPSRPERASCASRSSPAARTQYHPSVSSSCRAEIGRSSRRGAQVSNCKTYDGGGHQAMLVGQLQLQQEGNRDTHSRYSSGTCTRWHAQMHAIIENNTGSLSFSP